MVNRDGKLRNSPFSYRFNNVFLSKMTFKVLFLSKTILRHIFYICLSFWGFLYCRVLFIYRILVPYGEYPNNIFFIGLLRNAKFPQGLIFNFFKWACRAIKMTYKNIFIFFTTWSRKKIRPLLPSFKIDYLLNGSYQGFW